MQDDRLDMLFYRPFPSHRNSIMLWREGFFQTKKNAKTRGSLLEAGRWSVRGTVKTYSTNRVGFLKFHPSRGGEPGILSHIWNRLVSEPMPRIEQ